MSSNLLQLFQQAIPEMGLTTPSSVIGNNALDTVQSLALINAVGNELARQHQWQALTKEYRFTTLFYTYTGNTTTASVTVTGMSTVTGLVTSPATFSVTGTGINQDTYLVSVNAGGASAVMTQAATASGTLVTLTFSQTIYAMPSD